MAKAGSPEIELEGIRLTNPDKVLYPEQGITKRELAEYYLAVAPVMLPYVSRRPITVVRCPTGRGKKCFYQRHAGSGVPDQLKQIPIEGFDEPYLYLEDVQGLISLVQMGVLELHPWNSHVDQPHKPDQIVIDLDPGEGLTFPDVVEAAHEVRATLAGMGLQSVPKTTGGKGLHLIVPIERRYDWQDVKGFAKSLGSTMAQAAPDRYLIRQSIAERRGRIYIDYLRNDPTSTAVAPYSTRSREGATVSTPLSWDEVVPGLDPAAFNVRTIPARIAGLKSDPWAGQSDLEQRLPALPSPAKRGR